MTKGKIRRVLSKDNILGEITEYEIYRFYAGTDFKIGVPFSSPMPDRRDSAPSFNIKMINGGLHHTDFGDRRYRGDCFDFVSQMHHGISFQEALSMVDRDFGLGITSGEKYNIRKAPVYKVPKIEEKKASQIQFKGTQRYNLLEAKYWNDYHVSFEILKREFVYGVRSLFIDKEKIALPKNEPVFAYYEPSIDRVKIYRPFASKDKKEWKWRSTIPFTHMHGLENMVACEEIVTFKSNKDRLIGLHFLEQALAVQGESFAAISEESLATMKSLSTNQWLCFGTDPQGKKESQLITDQMGLKHINMPDSYLPLNDPAEVSKHYGMEAVKQHFINKGLLSGYRQTA